MWPEVFEPTQLGSFREKVHPPTTEPGDGPFVCVRFNKDWLPYVLGGLFQLVNPSSWLVADEPSLQEALERATALLDIFGKAGDCPPMDLRFTATCLLQSSVDGGATWVTVPGWDTNFPICNPPQTQVKFDADCLLTESFDGGETFEAVPGWAANFKDCVISNAPIIGLPPNPGGETHDQLACSIADYLASTIILEAMTQAVNAIQDDLTMLTFGASVLTLIPEFVLVAAAYDAFASIYGIISEGTLTDYQDALTNASLWNDVRCCIYGAIVADGYVTPGNFSAILTCISGITSAPSDVVSTIHSFLAALGATGTAQLSQIAGLNTEATCDCGSGAWCTWWQTGAGLDMCNGNSTSVDPGTGGGPATCSGGVWVAKESSAHDNYYTIVDFVLPFARTIRNARVDYTASGHDDDLRTIMYDASGATLFTANVRNWAAGGGAGISGVKKIRFICGMGGPTFFTLSSVKIGGPDQGSPWGVNNGVCG